MPTASCVASWSQSLIVACASEFLAKSSRLAAQRARRKRFSTQKKKRRKSAHLRKRSKEKEHHARSSNLYCGVAAIQVFNAEKHCFFDQLLVTRLHQSNELNTAPRLIRNRTEDEKKRRKENTQTNCVAPSMFKSVCNRTFSSFTSSSSSVSYIFTNWVNTRSAVTKRG